MYNRIRRIHLIGIGGIGMSSIAELLKRNGYAVSGSDLNRNETVRRLEDLGIEVAIGHRPENLQDAELVVYSSAVQVSNPEYSAAVSQEIPVIPRAEMLAELMRLKYGIAVAGAHGKTTTTSMIALALMEGGLDPTVVVGGRMDNFGGTNARLGAGEFLVAEADESDGSFNHLNPAIAIVTNMDREHMDFYKTMRKLRKCFHNFLNSVPFYGLAVVCGDDTQLRLILPKIRRRKHTYGFRDDNHYAITSYEPHAEGSRCEVRIGNENVNLNLRVPGRHNALNAVAALVVCDELGVPRETSLAALAKFQGVQRRFQLRGEKQGVVFVDDYAHHPREIESTLAAARERFPKAKIRVVFQPHRYSRVEDLFDEFSHCFSDCDSVAITDIYAAGETPIPGIDSQLLVESVRRYSNRHAVHYAKASEAIESWMASSAPGDLILTLGAGDLPNVYRELF